MFHHELVEGLLVFGEIANMTPLDLLRSATSDAAAACMLEHETGTLSQGLSADLTSSFSQVTHFLLQTVQLLMPCSMSLDQLCRTFSLSWSVVILWSHVGPEMR